MSYDGSVIASHVTPRPTVIASAAKQSPIGQWGLLRRPGGSSQRQIVGEPMAVHKWAKGRALRGRIRGLPSLVGLMEDHPYTQALPSAMPFVERIGRRTLAGLSRVRLR